MTPAIMRRLLALVLICGTVSLGAPRSLWAEAEQPQQVLLTWMSVTNWLFEIGNTRILMDGYITRIPEAAFSGVGFATATPTKPDEPAIRRLIDALGASGKIDFVLTGHSHYDHSFDAAMWSKLTDAPIIGSRSTCLQAVAQGVLASQCTAVEGGEVLPLGDHVTVRVVRWNHSGDVSTPMGRVLYTPMELVNGPTVPAGAEGLRPGTLQDFPNGGGARAYLFTVTTATGPVSWFYSNTGNAETFQRPAAVDAQFFQSQGFSLDNLVFASQQNSPQENLRAALKAAGLERVDVWIGYSDQSLAEVVGKILRPQVHIPHHWDGLFTSFFAGVPFPYASVAGTDRVAAAFKTQSITLLPPQQYMDTYRLTATGVTPIANDAIKAKLGLNKPPPAVFSAAPGRIAAHID
ncbi:MAG: MBL fold metallo-hydrolase [Deltaproteobacteria bacterium]|nr:MBL fold metallo-hydrolase [Deltaproteobacteria bacterium]